MEPINRIEEAKLYIESFEGEPEEFQLPISDELQDPIGMNMAIITDIVLKRGWMPNGFLQKEGSTPSQQVIQPRVGLLLQHAFRCQQVPRHGGPTRADSWFPVRNRGPVH